MWWWLKGHMAMTKDENFILTGKPSNSFISIHSGEDSGQDAGLILQRVCAWGVIGVLLGSPFRVTGTGLQEAWPW